MFEKYGGFRSNLGPRPGKDVQHCEGTEFGNRLLAAGERLWYEPSVVVYHRVAQDRLQKEYFLTWCAAAHSPLCRLGPAFWLSSECVMSTHGIH
jgi:hypothetical protein